MLSLKNHDFFLQLDDDIVMLNKNCLILEKWITKCVIKFL